MVRGDTFLYPIGNNPHLWVLISDFVDNACGDRHAVFVNFTTANGGINAVTISVAEANHPLITRDSEINYGDGLLICEKKLAAHVNAGRAISYPPLSEIVIQKIVNGGIRNQALSRGCRFKLGWDGRS
jgi:hypothetical protein